jgi:hypothetical protein
MHEGLTLVPTYVAVARLFVDDELRVLIQFNGTSQHHFYTVKRLDRGTWTEAGGEFQTLEAAKAAATV